MDTDEQQLETHATLNPSAVLAWTVSVILWFITPPIVALAWRLV